MPTLISSERIIARRDNSGNDTTTFENRDVIQVNVGRGRDLFCCFASIESQRNSQDDTDCLERLYQATDIILIICAVVIIVSVFISLGIFIFGWFIIPANQGSNQAGFIFRWNKDGIMME